MLRIDDNFLEQLIKEDVPYIDLTTLTLGIGDCNGQIKFACRDDIVLSGSEEVARLLEKLNIVVDSFLPTGTYLKKGQVFLTAHGKASALHMGWKIAQNIFEYCCSIATRTKLLTDKAKNINSDIAIVTTRKSVPGTKLLTLKSVLAGGAFPHRLGLSETILIFRQHLNFLNNLDELPDILKKIRTQVCEKKIIIEAKDEDEALRFAQLDIDGLQFDKFPASLLQKLIPEIRKSNKNLILIAAGGINIKNVEEYAHTDINAIATTAVYFGPPADIKVTIDKI